ncbi:MAG: MgtC/SapB family protein [Chloroflexota bacterium]|nr:MgtC/SapB family protein [Chloroflexota bacterium]
MIPVSEWEMAGRLVLATILGLLIGLERESVGQPAGERTHALVSLGSAAFSLISLVSFPGGDQARVAAGVVTGLGFLGAGMILKGEEEVHGLTTAAGIWVVGAVGLAIGAGWYLLGIATAALVGVVLGLERIFRIDERLAQSRLAREAAEAARESDRQNP